MNIVSYGIATDCGCVYCRSLEEAYKTHCSLEEAYKTHYKQYQNNFLYFLKEHTAIGRTVSALSEVIGESIDQAIARNAYYHFEALTDHDYGFNCVICGYYPSHLNWDLCKKGCFSLARMYTDSPSNKQ